MSNPILDDFSELDDPKKDLNPQDKSFITNFYIATHIQIIAIFAALATALASESFGFAFLLVSSISSIIGLVTSYWAIKIKFKKGVYFGLSTILSNCFLLFITYAISDDISPYFYIPYFVILVIWLFNLKKNLKIIYDFPEGISSSQKEEFTSIFYVVACFQVIVVFYAFIAAKEEISSILITGPISSSIGLITLYWAKKIKFKEGVYFGLFAAVLPLSLPLLIFFLSIDLSNYPIIVLTVFLLYFIILIIWLFRLEKILKK